MGPICRVLEFFASRATSIRAGQVPERDLKAVFRKHMVTQNYDILLYNESDPIHVTNLTTVFS